jgi:hypothetical protein
MLKQEMTWSYTEEIYAESFIFYFGSQLTQGKMVNITVVKLGYNVIQGTEKIAALWISVVLNDKEIKLVFKKKYIVSFCTALNFILNVN